MFSFILEKIEKAITYISKKTADIFETVAIKFYNYITITNE